MSTTTRRRLLAGVVALAAAAGLAACSDDNKSAESTTTAAPATTEGGASGEGKTIAIVSPYYSNQPATKEVVDAFKTAAEGKGYTVTLVDTKGDLAAVNGEMTNAVSQKVSAIVLGMGDPKEFSAGLKSAVDAKIPVFGLDAGSADGVVTNFTSDNEFLGETSAKALLDAMAPGKKIIVIHFDPFEPVRLRGAAAREFFTANGVTVLEDIQGDPADSTGFAKTTILDLLTKYPKGEVDGIWVAWDASALGAYQATVEAGRTEVKVVGVDGQDFARAEIKKEGSNWIATVRQDWAGIANKALTDIDAFLAGGAAPGAVVVVPGELITAANA
jgi:ribose transport system substrate-binding protein